MLSLFQQFHESSIRLLITTRPQFCDELRKRLEGAKVLEIKASEVDVELYLRDQVSKRKKHLKPELKEMIIQKVTTGHQEWY